MNITTDFNEIVERIHLIDPIKYSNTRNFLRGAVTQLSPYISRGVISTKMVLDTVLSKGYSAKYIEKFIQQLAWRDYWQQVWMVRGGAINSDLRYSQPRNVRSGLPTHMLSHNTGIVILDKSIETLYSSGLMHNHVRMYVASVACNVARCGWYIPAQWMYYHLLDADWASNALSWQWVAGANSKKLYFANQENINKYSETVQRGTFLDCSYEELERKNIPVELEEVEIPKLQSELPETQAPFIDPELPTLVYNACNVDPTWRIEMKANRILLLEPSVFTRYPMCKRTIDFVIELAQNNIPNVQVYVAEFVDLQAMVKRVVYYKEHPLNTYSGIEDSRTWLTSVRGDFPSFFAFWNVFKKELL